MDGGARYRTPSPKPTPGLIPDLSALITLSSIRSGWSAWTGRHAGTGSRHPISPARSHPGQQPVRVVSLDRVDPTGRGCRHTLAARGDDHPDRADVVVGVAGVDSPGASVRSWEVALSRKGGHGIPSVHWQDVLPARATSELKQAALQERGGLVHAICDQ